MGVSLGETLELAADTYPERDALVYPRRDQHLSYAEFDAMANRLANALGDLGVTKGDRVSTLLSNCSEIVLTVFACAKLGAVFTPVNTRLSTDECEYILDDAGASVLLYESATAEIVATADVETVETYVGVDGAAVEESYAFYDLVEGRPSTRPETVVEEDDTYAILYTSGTTGRPKGVVHEHRDVVEHNLILIAEAGLRRTDVGLSGFPLYHAGELHMLLPRLHLGTTNVVADEFDPERILALVDDHDVTVTFAAPTGWQSLVDAVDDSTADVSSLRLGLYGSAPMPADVLERCSERFDAAYLQGYGMTELGPSATFLHPEDLPEKRESAGLPALNHDLRIVEPDGPATDPKPRGERGEIIVASPCAMREYWNRPAATAEAFREADGRTWYYTGDIGFRDADGYLHVVDRKDHMIISGGENVYPAPVEDVLHGHPDVVAAAVVGDPHDRWGEVVVAYVVGDATAADIDQHVRDSDRIADFKRPRRYYFVDDLPRNAVGKVQRFRLEDGDLDVEPVEP